MTQPRRSRITPKSVKRAEVVSRTLVTAGGMGTIVAVVLIFAFLLWVVGPLFGGGKLDTQGAPAAKLTNGAVLQSEVDKLRLLTWSVMRDGTLRVVRLRDGTEVSRNPIFDGAPPTAWSFSPDGPDAAAGFEDGTVRVGRIKFQERFLRSEDADTSLRALKPGDWRGTPDGVVYVTPKGQLASKEVAISFDKPLAAAQRPIRKIDLSITNDGPVVATLASGRTLALHRFEVTEDFMSGEERTEINSRPLPAPPSDETPAFLCLDGTANSLTLVYRDGNALRYDTRYGFEAKVVEDALDFAPGPADVTVVRYAAGKTTLFVGDDRGVVRGFAPTRPKDAFAVDGVRTAHIRTLDGPSAAVTSLDGSNRARVFVVGRADGSVQVRQTTTEAVLGEGRLPDGARVREVILAPQDDELIAFADHGMQVWTVDVGHPEATLKTLFGSVWYEGANEPAHVWQSTGGTDQFEPKMGLMPLIFGTLKATLYSILIAAPLALLAAIFTSEFMTPRMRAPIKSVIELMAGLPSVVLGFLAAMVIAPFVRDWLPSTLMALVAVPFAFVLGGRLWQFLPQSTAIRLEGLPKLLFILGSLGLGLLMGMLAGPLVERWLFDGDMLGWIKGEHGDGSGGWILVMLPFAAFAVVLAMTWFVGPLVHRVSATWSNAKCAVVDIARLGAGVFATAALAWLLGNGLATLADPRDGIFYGGYEVKNALVVGFAMGFAVIPIIYTLAEDALSSVPRALREGSLGCGATPWQTAWRIVVPTAMSGLFSALMVGLGRAVGETMIVLMAVGNTAIMDWNPFSGMRPLSANLAVELPEAVKDSTHYRVLFLTAFVLFVMTFMINTVAELVRRTFRKRAAQL